MTLALAAGIDLPLLMRMAHRFVAESLRLCSVYLGIAVIVTVSMGVALPGLRTQALQVHEALLASLTSNPSLTPDAAHGTGRAVVLAVPETRPLSAMAFLGPARVDRSQSARRTGTEPTRAQAEALANYISRKYKIANDAADAMVSTAYKVGAEQRLDPLLLLAVIAIESRYNPVAESAVGAQGLMQVMTSIHKEKFEKYGENAALDPSANINVGSIILKDCIERRGSIAAGLSCYVGATGPNDGGYGAKVQAERRRLALASGIALSMD